ncbi:MAG: 1,6-anhydro-N-acetylmuramyl-L-alanine amidase AmpD [Succinivibrio sp.]|nr:1,6-anhydro-N-acetylmuramyl-L-alanine amidase AmpD [Succinivibrio sp.]
MQIDQDGWLCEARHLPTRNFNARPPHTKISLVVIHFISLPPCHFGGSYVDELFLGTLDPNAHPYFRDLAGAELSTHLFINRQGQITQYVSFLYRAWHAGRSSYHGQKECNDYSIGIELEGCEYCAYTKEQYRVLKDVLEVLRKTYPEIGDNLAGHNEVAPGRKVDPGPYFNWKLFRNQA